MNTIAIKGRKLVLHARAGTADDIAPLVVEVQAAALKPSDVKAAQGRIPLEQAADAYRKVLAGSMDCVVLMP